MTEIPDTCPRCGAKQLAAFYGPCVACRGELQHTAWFRAVSRGFIIQLAKFRWLA